MQMAGHGPMDCGKRTPPAASRTALSKQCMQPTVLQKNTTAPAPPPSPHVRQALLAAYPCRRKGPTHRVCSIPRLRAVPSVEDAQLHHPHLHHTSPLHHSFQPPWEPRHQRRSGTAAQWHSELVAAASPWETSLTTTRHSARSTTEGWMPNQAPPPPARRCYSSWRVSTPPPKRWSFWAIPCGAGCTWHSERQRD